MKIKALKSFGGMLSMNIGEVADVEDSPIVRDLIKSGTAEEIKEKPKAKPKAKK